MSNDVEYLVKEPVRCPCGDFENCDKWMMPKPGGKHHKKCGCLDKCQKYGKRRKDGLKGQVVVAQAFGVQGVSNYNPGNEEMWKSAVRLEAKQGAQCDALMNFYRKTYEEHAFSPEGKDKVFVSGGVVGDFGLVQFDMKQMPKFIHNVGEILGYFNPDQMPDARENWFPAVEVEFRSGENECGPLATFYRNTRKQSDAAKRIGDTRLFVSAGVTETLALVQMRTIDVPRVTYDTGGALGFWPWEK